MVSEFIRKTLIIFGANLENTLEFHFIQNSFDGLK